jgi:predicted unusual protein kinase regulating ubiquinone biosynthesis (AarF/ABC1/UbiB family)
MSSLSSTGQRVSAYQYWAFASTVPIPSSGLAVSSVQPVSLRVSHLRPLKHVAVVGPRMVLADKPRNSVPRYVGTPRTERRGRLRLDFTRYAEPGSEPRAPVPLNADDYRWASGGYNKVTRTAAVWSFVGRLLAANWINGKRWSYWMFDKSEDRVRQRRRALAAFARESILNFGPTLIKVGQLASARSDVFPAEVIEELSALQDRVPGFSWRVAEEILREQYGKPVDEVFTYFEKDPIAAASLGQVHRAGLRSGEDVVVKIQRPSLKHLFDLDLDALHTVAVYLQKSKEYGGNTRDWVGIYEECRKVLYEEIDYIREANNCEQFRENFKDYPHVRIPKAYLDYTTTTVLCLQYVPGINIRDRDAMVRAGINPKLVARRSGTILLKQILDYALFTADPHSGNVAVSPQNGGTIILVRKQQTI